MMTMRFFLKGKSMDANLDECILNRKRTQVDFQVRIHVHSNLWYTKSELNEVIIDVMK
jgi:hypothetical protein